MNTEKEIPSPEAFGLTKGTIAYIRSVSITELDEEIETPEGIETFYALHDASGRRLALFDNRDFAFEVAKRNDLTPMSAH